MAWSKSASMKLRIPSHPTTYREVIPGVEANLLNSDMIINARGVMIIVVGNGHGDTSSNPGRD